MSRLPIIATGLSALPVSLLFLTAVAVGSGATTSQPAAPAACASGVSIGERLLDGTRLDADELGNATTIDEIAIDDGLPQRAAVIAIATAMQESRLHNLTMAVNGDSLGLFQQRPSQGWGTPAQLTTPAYAAQAFLSRLVQVPNWQQLRLTVAAQDVQHSADRSAYARWEPLADELVATITGATQNCATDNASGTPARGAVRLPRGFRLPAGTNPKVATAIAWAVRQLGGSYSYGGTCTHPLGDNPATRCDCSSLVMVAYEHAGIDLPRTTQEQVEVGQPIYRIGQIQPGDLLFEVGEGDGGTVTSPGHVGMAVGSGLVIEAPHTGAVIRLDPLRQWAPEIVAMRRVA